MQNSSLSVKVIVAVFLLHHPRPDLFNAVFNNNSDSLFTGFSAFGVVNPTYVDIPV